MRTVSAANDALRRRFCLHYVVNSDSQISALVLMMTYRGKRYTRTLPVTSVDVDRQLDMALENISQIVAAALSHVKEPAMDKVSVRYIEREMEDGRIQRIDTLTGTISYREVMPSYQEPAVRFERPQPIAYSQHEGDEWQRWVPVEERIAAWRKINSNDMTDDEVMIAVAMVPRNPAEIFHAVMFDDGSILDAVNGWRSEPDPEYLQRVKAWIAMTEEEKAEERRRFYNP